MKNLSSIDLVFNSSLHLGSISQEEVSILASSLEEWKSLESLRLEFRFNKGNGDNLILQLQGAIAKLQRLKSIEISFYMPVRDENQMIRHFLKQLTPLKNLESLILGYCPSPGSIFDLSVMRIKDNHSLRRLSRVIINQSEHKISYL